MPDPTPSEKFQLVIVTPDKVIFEGTAKRIIAPGIEQHLAVLPDHTPIFAEITQGELEVTNESNQLEKIPVESGVLRFKSNKATIITGF